MTLPCSGTLTPWGCFLAGDSYPDQGHIEAAISDRLGWLFAPLLLQRELIAHGGRERHETDIATRLHMLEQVVAVADPGRKLVLFGRSSGARVATMFAGRGGVAGVVCLGYPFRPPGEAADPMRYAHLAGLTTPTLIVQGDDDRYGAAEVTQRYSLSASVQVHLVVGSHELFLAPAAWDAIAARIVRFLSTILPVARTGPVTCSLAERRTAADASAADNDPSRSGIARS